MRFKVITYPYTWMRTCAGEEVVNRSGSSYAISKSMLVGDCRTAALMSPSGSMTGFVSLSSTVSVFNCLLNHKARKLFQYYSVRSIHESSAHRNPTAVLIIEFRTYGGVIRVTDCMPVISEENQKHCLTPLRSVLRYLEGVKGMVRLVICCRQRPDHARVIPCPSSHRFERYTPGD